MANPVPVIKAATSALAASAALLAALKDAPKITEAAKATVDNIKSALRNKSAKVRFDAKIDAIEACADAVDEVFPGTEDARVWRQKAASLRMRGQLAWASRRGSQRRAAMRQLDEETADLLATINERLAMLSPDLAAREVH
ncbi:hypothetical protein [uncultured Tessaracoccus sp.]|uniref:hypothetical protein n=1 Tax=uncultured Tessaracoccus sp. TaxID=905023 RepID=UPI002631EB71|nr:hypothetical protein [uncultured Tessaracoccus sp.]